MNNLIYIGIFGAVLFSIFFGIYYKHIFIWSFSKSSVIRTKSKMYWKAMFSAIKILCFGLIAYGFFGQSNETYDLFYAGSFLVFLLAIIWPLGDLFLNTYRNLDPDHSGSNFMDRFGIWIKLGFLIGTGLLFFFFDNLFLRFMFN